MSARNISLLMSARNICFHGKIRRISSTFWLTFFEAILSLFFFTFIDHKSRMTQIYSFKFHFFITCV